MSRNRTAIAGWVLAAMFGAVAAPSAQVSPAGRAPTDEARRDPSLRALRRQLLAAAARRDAGRLRPLLAEHLRVDFEEVTSQGFLDWLRQQPPAERAVFWRDLRDAVTIGFVVHGDAMCAPSAHFDLPEDDGFETAAVVGVGVRARRAPDARAAVVASLTHAVVSRGPAASQPAPGFGDGTYEWEQIRLPDGTLGWVVSKYLVFAGGRRFCFERIGGVWKLSAVAIGD